MTPRVRSTRISRTLRGVLLVGLFCLVALEILLRLSILLPGSSPLFVSDPEVGFRMRPGIVHGGQPANSSGFNDREHAAAKRQGVTRLAFIGDSFVVGAVPRAENFTSVVEELARASGQDLEVLNMGIPAAGPENYLRILENDAVDMDVDVAVVVFFVGNDVSQSHPDFVTRIWFGGPRQVTRSPLLLKPSTEYLSVYRLFRSGFRLLRHSTAPPNGGTFSEETFLRIEHQRMEICEIDEDPFVAAGYRGAGELFERMRDRAADLGMELFVVLAPDQFQVDAELRSAVAKRFSLDLEDYDLTRPQRILTRSLADLGIPALDLLPDFQGHDEESPLYLLRDTHWNREGNRVAAESIHSFLRSRPGARRHRLPRLSRTAADRGTRLVPGWPTSSPHGDEACTSTGPTCT